MIKSHFKDILETIQKQDVSIDEQFLQELIEADRKFRSVKSSYISAYDRFGVLLEQVNKYKDNS